MGRILEILKVIIWITLYCYPVVAASVPCTENRSESCIHNLSTFISLQHPRFVAQLKLEKLCRVAEDGQKCSSDFLRTASCIDPDDAARIPLQVGRSQAVVQALCSVDGYVAEQSFRKAYLRHAPCIGGRVKAIRECYTSSSLPADPEYEVLKNSSRSRDQTTRDVCCPMFRYMDCCERAVESACGPESKRVFFNVLTKSAGKKLFEFCSESDPGYPHSSYLCENGARVSASLLFLCAFMQFLLFLKEHHAKEA